MAQAFVFTGGGTGGHVFPALAVARVLQARGHRVLFVGTKEGMEARLVPEAGFDIEFVRSGGLNRVGFVQQFKTMTQLPLGIAAARSLLRKFGAQAVFSTGGYVAGPVMLAAALAGIPLVVMEPNSVPGFANRKMATTVYRALLGFETTRRWFPADRAEVTGLPVRPDFFALHHQPQSIFTVLITGGSRGLGREMAFAAAHCGADVVIASRNMDSCVATAKEIEAETGRSAMPYQVHVGRWDQLDGLVEATYARFGKVDTLINNAGMSPLYDKLSDVTEKLFDAVINLNLKGPFRLSALVGERMVAAGSGSIINVSSTGSLRPGGDIIPYAAAKAGLNAMTEGLARAFGPTVRVNTLMAGPFLTDVSKAWNLEKAKTNMFCHLSLQRAGSPPEIVGGALFLASDASSFTTGSILRADGGFP